MITCLDPVEVRKDRGWYGGTTEFRYPKEGRVGLQRHNPRDNRHRNPYEIFGQMSDGFYGKHN